MRKKDVVEHFGSVVATAEELGVTSQAVSQWGEIIPERMAYRVEKRTRGKFKVDPALYQRDRLTA